MHDVNGPCIDFAFAAIAQFVIGLDAAIESLCKAGVHLACEHEQPWIDRPEEHARRGRRDCAVHVIENAVAENPMMPDVVRNRQIKRLVEIGQPIRRPCDDRRKQNRKNDQSGE